MKALEVTERGLIPGRRPSEAVIDLAAFRHNLNEVRYRVGKKVGIMSVIKANAYGHGMVELGREAIRWGVQAIGVATVDEALSLRETAGFQKTTILVMGPSFIEDAELLQDADISVTVGTLPLLRTHLALGRRRKILPRLHLKVDTGMGRYGFRPDNITFLDLFADQPDALEGLMTHFAVSDETDRESIDYTLFQRDRFNRVIQRVTRAGLRPIYHAANSGAVLNHPDCHYEICRPGMMLYGANPDPHGETLPLKQVMELKSRIVSINPQPKGASISYGCTFKMPEDGQVGLLPIGYGDGVPRSLSNQGHVLHNGKRIPIIGRVCMDQILINLTNVPEARVGDEVVFYGHQGKERISLEEVAIQHDSIPYEITSQVSRRIPRRYIDSEKDRN